MGETVHKHIVFILYKRVNDLIMFDTCQRFG
jgi:hypothetical protein